MADWKFTWKLKINEFSFIGSIGDQMKNKRTHNVHRLYIENVQCSNQYICKEQCPSDMSLAMLFSFILVLWDSDCQSSSFTIRTIFLYTNIFLPILILHFIESLRTIVWYLLLYALYSLIFNIFNIQWINKTLKIILFFFFIGETLSTHV